MVTRVPAEVFPPGDFIREELDARGWTQSDLAAIVDRPVETVNRIISGKRGITADTAHALGQAFGTGPEYWLNLDAAYQLWHSTDFTTRENGISLKARLYGIAPITEMTRRGWIAGSTNARELERQVKTVFELGSIDEPITFLAAAKKSTGGDFTGPQLAWLFRARKIASAMSVGKFSKKTLREALPRIRELAMSCEDVRKVPALLTELGLRFVVIEHLQKTRIDGTAFWLNATSPVIAMSERLDRIDDFWFVLCHELGHILNGDKLSLDSDLCESESEDETEQRANEFASDFLIPKEEMDTFILRVHPLYSKVKIRGFAERMEIHPGIVVGQLQGRGMIKYSHSREMLVKVRDLVTSSARTDGWGHEPPISLMVT